MRCEEEDEGECKDHLHVLPLTPLFRRRYQWYHRVIQFAVREISSSFQGEFRLSLLGGKTMV